MLFPCEQKVRKRWMKPLGNQISGIQIKLGKELKIGDKDFLSPVEKECFEEMLVKHGKVFAFEPHEIGCVDPSVIAPMVIFTILHVLCGTYVRFLYQKRSYQS